MRYLCLGMSICTIIILFSMDYIPYGDFILFIILMIDLGILGYNIGRIKLYSAQTHSSVDNETVPAPTIVLPKPEKKAEVPKETMSKEKVSREVKGKIREEKTSIGREIPTPAEIEKKTNIRESEDEYILSILLDTLQKKLRNGKISMEEYKILRQKYLKMYRKKRN